MNSSISPCGRSERMSTPLPMMFRSPPGSLFSSATAIGTSPVSRVEFGQRSWLGGGRGDVLRGVVQGLRERAIRDKFQCPRMSS